jgi:tRNA-uridine 2-sulfurtransferase
MLAGARLTAAPSDPFALLPDSALVAVAMSGGVDSSVAAARLAEAGYRTVGITLALWPRTRELVRDRGCCSIDAVDDARRVAGTLGIRHYVWNLEAEFESAVIAEFSEEYARGRTPNPCVRCNERVKFGVLLERARAVGATHVATGHYARIGRTGGEWTLHRSLDPRKDQSYTLHRLGQEQLAAAVFPLGSAASKSEVRAEARRQGLLTAEKPESQDLCFVDGSIAAELRRRLDGRYTPGPIVDGEGRELGRHRGLPFYTVGQRTGLGIAPTSPNAPSLHVIALRPADNSVVVGERAELARTDVELGDVHWVGSPPREGAGCGAQLRAHGDVHPATLGATSEDGVSVRLEEPAMNVTPGQSLVLYEGDRVLGGGVIARAA